jgi:hypothetical protein
LSGRSRNAAILSSISPAEAADLALRDPGHAHRLGELVDRAGRDALDVGVLDHRRQRLLGHPARFQEAGEVAAAAQLRDAQLDRAGARLPDPVAVAVAVVDALGAALAMRRAGQALDLELHQALRGEADHLAHQLDIGALLQQRPKAHHLVGHRVSLVRVEVWRPKPYRDSR